MTGYDDEILMRRIDGELSPEVSARIDAEALDDADLTDRLAGMRRLRTLARDAFALIPDPRDAALSRLVAGVDLRASPWTRMYLALADAFAPRRAALWGGLAVATFAVGVYVGPLLGSQGETFHLSKDGAISDAGLLRVMEERLASDGPDAEGRSVALTYRDLDDRWCRTFNAGEAGVAGLACRDEGQWTIRILAPLSGSLGEVRTAATATPAVILSAVDAGLAGETLDAAAEARARDEGWR